MEHWRRLAGFPFSPQQKEIRMNKSAASLAFIIGALSVIAGGMVIRGWQPGWLVLNWLPVYNFIMGVLTVFIPAVLIWKNSRYAMPAAVATFGIHAITTLLLLSAFRGTPAAQSIFAMIFRLIVWLVILALLFFNSRKKG
jgi:hypothetical protein